MSIARMIAGAGFSTAWNISAARYVRFFSVASQETSPRGVFFKPDGQEMFITGIQSDDVIKYALSSPWDASSATYSSAFPIPGSSVPEDLFFKPDGTKMYVIKNAFVGVEEFNLPTPWSFASASSATVLSTASNVEEIRGLFFKPDGTKLYVAGETAGVSTLQRKLVEYSLSSPWDLSTATYSTFNSLPDSARTRSIFFRQDGRKMYAVRDARPIDEYNLSTAWDISTIARLQQFSVATEETSPEGIFFRQDGTRMYVVGQTSDAVHEYNLTSASRAASYRTAGTYTFVVPSAITSVTLSLVGGSGGGASGGTTVSGEKNPVTTNYFGGDGGSGASATKTLSVTPGESLTIVVGAGGAGGAAPGVENVGVNPGSNGADSTVTQSASVVARADAGSGAPSTSDGAGGLASASTGDTTTNGVTGAGGAGGFGASQSGTAGVAGSVIITW